MNARKSEKGSLQFKTNFRGNISWNLIFYTMKSGRERSRPIVEAISVVKMLFLHLYLEPVVFIFQVLSPQVTPNEENKK